jgi:mannose-6-phosphate isomerase-like protein (cupin superfamily)
MSDKYNFKKIVQETFASSKKNNKPMRKKLLKKSVMYLFILFVAYLVIGNMLHLVIFPEKKPTVSAFFKPGQAFYSKAEGFKQIVAKQENGFVYSHLEIEPFAGGPPEHIHEGFDETFEIENGELTIWVDGVIKKVRPGEVVLIPKGTPHKPYNETAETIRTKGTFAFPEKFAYHLPQVYSYMEQHPNFAKEPKTVFQMALFQQAGFDSYVADGPPVFIQKTIAVVANPMARLLGLKTYDQKNNIVMQSTQTQAALISE